MRDASRSRAIPYRWPSAWAPFATAASFRPPPTTFWFIAPLTLISRSPGSTGRAHVSGRVSEPGGFRGVALSPDGTRAVASRTNPQDAAKADLWLLDLSRGSGATRLTLGTGIAEFPVWSPDGTRIVFTFGNKPAPSETGER